MPETSDIDVPTRDAGPEECLNCGKQGQSALSTTSGDIHKAPYYWHEEDAIPGSYIVPFHREHTLDDHFDFVGRRFELIELPDQSTDLYSDGYIAELDDRLFDAVRRDPSVIFVEDNTHGIQQSAQHVSTNGVCEAPYYRHEEGATPGLYRVKFRRGHTFTAHFTALGWGRFQLTDLRDGYIANLTDRLLRAIRRDVGIEFVEDDISSGGTGRYRAPYLMNESPIPDSYIVMFHPGHTITKHYEAVGRHFELTDLRTGYFANLDDELFNAVRNDPGVRSIENNTSGGELD